MISLAWAQVMLVGKAIIEHGAVTGALLTALITGFVGLAMLRKVKRNHFYDHTWRPVLAAIGCFFMVDSLTHLIATYHEWVHVSIHQVHYWFAPIYMADAAMALVFFIAIVREAKNISNP